MIRKYRRERCTLSNIGTELESFLETGVSGGCGDTEAVIHPEKDGFVSLDFRDSRITDVPEGKLVSRAMMAGKRKFLVRSFFSCCRTNAYGPVIGIYRNSGKEKQNPLWG